MNNEQVNLASFIGRQFQNPSNVCYINSVLNSLLTLDLYRERLNDKTCNCNLCEFLRNSHVDATTLRIWASQFNPTFKRSGRHEDAEEFLRVMIDNYANLSNLAQFGTKEKHTCTVCYTVTHIPEELNRDIKQCPFNIDHDFQNENTADMLKRTNPVCKICKIFGSKDSEDGVSHNVNERYTRPPQVHMYRLKDLMNMGGR